MWAAGAALLIGLVAPVGRRAIASVTLNYFRAQWRADFETAFITWQTATELNTVGFIVQRSTSATTGFADITAVIPAQGDQLTGFTYDPVTDDPLELTIGVTYWYRLVVINTSPPNDELVPVGVLAGTEGTLTPTPSQIPTRTDTATTAPSSGSGPTATPTPTPTPTATATRTPTPTPSPSPTVTLSPTPGPSPTPSATFIGARGSTVTPGPLSPVAATTVAATTTPANPAAVRTATPDSGLAVTISPNLAAPTATPIAIAAALRSTVTPAPTSIQPTLAPTNATIIAIAPIIVAGESTPQAEAEPAHANLSIVVLIGAAGVLLLGGVYAILRQTGK